VRVVIAEDCVLLRAGIARLLEEAGFDVAGQAGDGEELLRKVRAHQPDVVVADIRMPPDQRDEGVRAAREIRRAWPHIGVLLLSQHLEERYAGELLAHGARGIGYLLKDRVADVARFTDAVRAVGAGGAVLDPEVVAHMVGRRRAGRAERARSRRARPDRRGGEQPRHRPPALPVRARRGAPRDRDLRETGPCAVAARPPARPRRARSSASRVVR
jgi:DNA-binding NarL/FixJ family response regulator